MEKIVNRVYAENDMRFIICTNTENYFSVIVKSGETLQVSVIEPEKKKLDWSKIPVNTVVSVSYDGEHWSPRRFLRQAIDGGFEVFANGTSKDTGEVNFSYKHCKLIEQTTFTFWHGGGCPLPHGVMVGIVFRNGNVGENQKATDYVWLHNSDDDDIIAYRIIGLADGWEY